MSGNREAAEATIRALRELGRLEDVDSAQVEAVLSIAAALDANPGNAQLWRAYQEALDVLRRDDSVVGGIDDLLEDLRSAVRDPEKGS